MGSKLKRVTLTILAAAMLALPAVIPSVAYAENAVINSVCEGVNTATTTEGTEPTNANCTTSTDGAALDGIIRFVINTFSVIVGAVSVLMIIYGGFKYITSGGDSSNVSGAKNTILYALLGLVIVALSQLIVYFVLSKAAQF